MNIIIPAAGEGSRFKQAGYKTPKYMIDILGKPMITRVIESVLPNGACSVQVLTQENIGHPTGGAVETILCADITDEPLLIANSDQLVAFDVNKFIESAEDGIIATFRSNKPHHSYVKIKDGVVTEIKEKEV